MKRLVRNWTNIAIAACIIWINWIILNQIGIAYGRYDWMSYLGPYGVYGSSNPAPILSSLGPVSIKEGNSGFSLSVTGTNFISSSVVRWKGSARGTKFVSSSQLQATIPSTDIAASGVAYVAVFNPAPGGGQSNPLAFYITSTGAPVTASNTASGTNPSATTGTNGISAAAIGTGTVSVAQYDGNPGGPSGFNSVDAYVDVHIAPGSAFTTLTIVDCDLNGGKVVYWWDGAAWKPASAQAYDAKTHCVTVTVDNFTSPSLGQLAGTVFGSAVDYGWYMPWVQR